MASDDDVQTKLALAALIVAVVAFFIAAAQVLQQYLTSNYREKCMTGAIGSWSRYTKTSWNMLHWRLDVQYPNLDLSANSVRGYVLNRLETSSLEKCFKSKLPELEGNKYELVDVHHVFDYCPRLRWYHIYYLNEVMLHRRKQTGCNVYDIIDSDEREKTGAERDKVVTLWDLGWRGKFKWILFLFSRFRVRPSRIQQARAGWANLLGLFGVYNIDKALIEKSSYSPADLIPGQIDVPIQTIELRDLILLCFATGIKNIKVDLSCGEIVAENKFIRIATQQVPAVGKVVAIEGDFGPLRAAISKAPRSCVASSIPVASGKLIFGDFYISPTSVDVAFILLALRQRWSGGQVKVNLKYHRDKNLCTGQWSDPKVSLYSQARIFREGVGSDSEAVTPVEWAEFWTEKIGSATPTYLTVMAFIDIMCIWSGRPLDLLLNPYNGYIRKNRKAWYEWLKINSSRSGDTVLKPFDDQQINRSIDSSITTPYANLSIDASLIKFSNPLIREDSDYLLTVGRYLRSESRYGGRSWVSNYNLAYLKIWDPVIAAEISDPTANLPMPTQVMRLLDGNPVEDIRDYLRNLELEMGEKMYTLESAVYIALLIIGSRLQAEWLALAPGPDDFLSSDHARTNNMSIQDLIHTSSGDNGDERLGSALADFLAFWVELCRRADCTATPETIWEAFDAILVDWEDDDTLCLRNLPSDHPLRSSAISTDGNGEPKTRGDFVRWVKTEDRLSNMKRMVVMMQLRVFLTHLSYLCHADSSIALEAEYQGKIKLQVI